MSYGILLVVEVNTDIFIRTYVIPHLIQRDQQQIGKKTDFESHKDVFTYTKDLIQISVLLSLSDVIIAIEYPSLHGSEIEIDCKNLKIKNEVRKRNLTSYEV